MFLNILIRNYIMKKKGTCQITGKQFPGEFLLKGISIRKPVLSLIQKEHPDFNVNGYISLDQLNHYRQKYVQMLITRESRELNELEKEVLNKLKESDLLSRNINEDAKEGLIFGQRVADGVALFGGSWTFIIIFFLFLFLWMIINVFVFVSKPFDPYPFILLNLVLSCIAAIQAPIIMMSQNRQESKDRLRSQNDYQVNLKSELEIRVLNEKIDHLINHQVMRLMEVQDMQMEYLEELLSIKTDRKK